MFFIAEPEFWVSEAKRVFIKPGMCHKDKPSGGIGGFVKMFCFFGIVFFGFG